MEKNYIKQRLSELYDNKLKSLEKKFLNDLKDIEIMKYELRYLNEGTFNRKKF